MEMFRLDTKMMKVDFGTWYDHSNFGLELNNVSLQDLTGYPYTVNPE